MMIYIWVSLGISVAGFFASIGTSAFMSGVRWGAVQADITYMRRDLDAIMRYFKLTPAEQQNHRRN